MNLLMGLSSLISLRRTSLLRELDFSCKKFAMARYPLYDILPLGLRFWVLYNESCDFLNFAISLFHIPGSVNEFVGI